MAKKKRLIFFGVTILTVVSLVVAVILLTPATRANNNQKTYDDLHVDSMHPWITSEGPGTCSICGMNLSKVNGHKPGSPLPSVDDLFVDPSNPMWVHEGPGKSPDTGEDLIPIKESPYYQPPKDDQIDHDHYEDNVDMQSHDSHKHDDHVEETGQLYTCGMHPDVIQDKPGICPICNMDLTPLKQKRGASSSGKREIAYWVAPMDPGYISDSPGKSPMGMDLVPVYTDQLSEGTVQIDPVTLQSIGVKTKPAELRDLSQTIRSNGIVQSAEDSEFKINARIKGWVEKLYVSRTGDQVRAGQPLLEIYSPELVAAQEELVLADQNSSNSSVNLVEAAKQRLRLWNISESQIEELERTHTIKQTLTLTSPGNGIILHKNVVEGSSVNSGMDLFKIADLSSVWIIAQVYEYEVPWISIGDKAEISSPYDPELNIEGTLSFIYPTLNSRSRTVEVRIEIPNPDLLFKPEMYVDVHIETSKRDDVIAIPKSALIRSGERDLVFVKRGQGMFEPVEVHVGLEAKRYYEILHGLHPGEEVVISAQFLLDSEAKLQEAIQRRIEQRRQMKTTSSNMSETTTVSTHSH